MRKAAMASAARAAAAALLLTAGGCGHLPHWPWHRAPAPPPPAVHELDIGGADGAGTYAQYWKRNTLVVDLRAARGSGSIVLKPVSGTGWPVRLAFRIVPGSIGVLEVEAAQRATLPITPAGSQPIDLELTPGIYRADSPEMTVSWGPEATP